MKEKIKCIVKNPSDRSKQSWFYNIFLGGIYDEPKHQERMKVNWVMELEPDEIKTLKNKTALVIPLKNGSSNNVKLEHEETSFREEFNILSSLFNRSMKDPELKGKIKQMLMGEDGNPTSDYLKIMDGIKKLKELEEQNE
jgi:hypothetical protein